MNSFQFHSDTKYSGW